MLALSDDAIVSLLASLVPVVLSILVAFLKSKKASAAEALNEALIVGIERAGNKHVKEHVKKTALELNVETILAPKVQEIKKRGDTVFLDRSKLGITEDTPPTSPSSNGQVKS